MFKKHLAFDREHENSRTFVYTPRTFLANRPKQSGVATKRYGKIFERLYEKHVGVTICIYVVLRYRVGDKE
ncbi:hypothetical protein CEXT_342511 [Caerostris extrusa]|uniref:Uncharacterized protein n=1 Tax=Caerostris extrusa TaxID=172846 RepID=A0AAV4TPF5_CAEEX|nr:hypothetical protein CEXT_342511 [Caerostris extrusa]